MLHVNDHQAQHYGRVISRGIIAPVIITCHVFFFFVTSTTFDTVFLVCCFFLYIHSLFTTIKLETRHQYDILIDCYLFTNDRNACQYPGSRYNDTTRRDATQPSLTSTEQQLIRLRADGWEARGWAETVAHARRVDHALRAVDTLRSYLFKLLMIFKYDSFFTHGDNVDRYSQIEEMSFRTIFSHVLASNF